MSEHRLKILRLEIDTAIDRNFWGNPKKPWRPKTDPGKVGFQKFHFSTPPATAAGVFGGAR
jgi:hypothetical protein